MRADERLIGRSSSDGPSGERPSTALPSNPSTGFSVGVDDQGKGQGTAEQPRRNTGASGWSSTATSALTAVTSYSTPRTVASPAFPVAPRRGSSSSRAYDDAGPPGAERYPGSLVCCVRRTACGTCRLQHLSGGACQGVGSGVWVVFEGQDEGDFGVAQGSSYEDLWLILR